MFVVAPIISTASLILDDIYWVAKITEHSTYDLTGNGVGKRDPVLLDMKCGAAALWQQRCGC